MTGSGAVHDWTFEEDSVLIAEYQGGVGWEERAAALLAGRSPAACEGRAAILHLRPSTWMKHEMKRMGMQVGTGK